MNINRRVLFAVLAILGLVVLVEGGVFLQNKLKKRSFTPPIVEEVSRQAGESSQLKRKQALTGAEPASKPAPTVSPEEIKAIIAAKVVPIKVAADKAEPADLTIKPYDQIRWDNQTDRKMVVKTLDQTSPPLAKGKKFLVSFKQKGSFTYRVLLDGQEKFTGTIKVE